MLAAFAQAARSDVVVVVAPSGFGKSVALCQHLATLQSPGIEYGLRAGFTVADVVRSLATLIGASEGLAAIMHAVDERGLQPYVARWLGERIEDAGVPWIALEDAGLAAPEVRGFLGDLLAQPCAVRWYIVIRESEDLPLGPLLADGRLARAIDSAVLAFDSEEVALLALARGLALTAEESAQLLQRNDGWPVAVSLALQSGGDGLVDCRSPDARDALCRYVIDRANSELGESDREVLSWGAYAPLRPNLLERLGIADAGTALQRLSRVIPLLRSAGGEVSAHGLLMETFAREEALLPSEARKENGAASATPISRSASSAKRCARSYPATIRSISSRSCATTAIV